MVMRRLGASFAPLLTGLLSLAATRALQLPSSVEAKG